MPRAALILALALAACRTTHRVRLPDAGIARASNGYVAFIRATPERLVATSLGDEQATELWIAKADGTEARRLVVGVAAGRIERALAALSSPRFSPDGRRIYFLSRAWVTSDAVHAVEVASGREWFVTPGNSLEVIPSGPLAGCLLVSQHRYWPNEGGSYDWTWLLASSGHEIALAAPDSDAAERRLVTWMGGVIPPGTLQESRTAPPRARCR